MLPGMLPKLDAVDLKLNLALGARWQVDWFSLQPRHTTTLSCEFRNIYGACGCAASGEQRNTHSGGESIAAATLSWHPH